MQRILVTGGNGGLGRQVVAQLVSAGYQARVRSRQLAPTVTMPIEWAQADLATGVGLDAALAGCDTVIHAASSPYKNTHAVDVEGTQRLLDRARAAGVGHLVYISIVGTDQVPMKYYRSKTEAEQLIERSRVPWTILRATQFHTLIDAFLSRANRLPLFLLPTDLQFQPIETGEAARRLVELAAGIPVGRAPDIGGPEVLRFGELAEAWLAARGTRRPIVPLPRLGKLARALRQGRLTCPEQRYGAITWAEWLRTTCTPQAVAV